MKVTAAFSLAALWAMGAVSQAQITIQPYKYSVTYQQAYDLGTLGGTSSEAIDINDGGDI